MQPSQRITLSPSGAKDNSGCSILERNNMRLNPEVRELGKRIHDWKETTKIRSIISAGIMWTGGLLLEVSKGDNQTDIIKIIGVGGVVIGGVGFLLNAYSIFDKSIKEAAEKLDHIQREGRIYIPIPTDEEDQV